MKRNRPPMERFAKKVKRLENGCWLWTAGLKPKGYGAFWYGGRGNHAHIFAFEAFRFAVPPGKQLDHLCRNRACVNPFHLEAVTPQINVLRGKGLAAINAKKTHCLRGHKFDEKNTLILPDRNGQTKRACHACAEEYARRYRALHKLKISKQK